MIFYPKNHCFLHPSPALQCKSSMIFMKKNVTKIYDKYEIQRLSKRKHNRERRIGAGRHFKLNLEDRFLMLLVYFRLT